MAHNRTLNIGLLWLLAAVAPAAFSATASLPEQQPADDFRDVLAKSGATWIAGQPTEQGLAHMRSEGVTTVVSLRTAAEMNDRAVVPFDEAAVVGELGMTYVHIPLGGPDTPYTPAAVEQFAAAMDAAQGKVLLHCTVGWRASHMWTAYLVQYKGLSLGEAVRHGEAINLGALPLQGLLGKPLTLEYR